MNTNPENSLNENEANIQSGITRRSFVKRTTATAIVVVLAINSFRNEARAAGGGPGSDPYTIEYQGGANVAYPNQNLGTITVSEGGSSVVYTLWLTISVGGSPKYGDRSDNWSFGVTGTITAAHPVYQTRNISGASASGTITKAMTDKIAPTTTDAGSTNGSNTKNVFTTATTVECTRSGTSMAVKGTAGGTSKTVTVTISLTNVKESSAKGVPPNPNPNP